MKKIKVILAGLLLLLATACSSISSGTIIDKDHSEGYYYTTFICSSYNAQGVCMVQMPIQNWQPPRWKFDLKEADETGWVYVTEGTFNSYEIGDYYQGKEK